MSIKDLTGIVFGKLVVVSFAGKNKHGCSLWLCRCDCGVEKVVNSNCLNTGKTKSCGCYRKAQLEIGRNDLHKSQTRHKMSKTKEHRTWRGIRSRCNDVNNKGYPRYGGRGIKVCERWDSFENFLADMGFAPSPKHSIDRYPDNDGPYSPDNCRWATEVEQKNNRSDNRPLTYKGRTMNLVQWSNELGIDKTTIHSRLVKSKWSVEKAFETPIDEKKSVRCRNITKGIYHAEIQSASVD